MHKQQSEPAYKKQDRELSLSFLLLTGRTEFLFDFKRFANRFIFSGFLIKLAVMSSEIYKNNV